MNIAPDIDFRHVRELGNELLSQINQVRSAHPLYWSETQKAWIVTGHAQVAEGFSGRLPFSNERMSKVSRFMPDPEERKRRIPTVLRLYPLQLVGLDPPQQLRMRRLLMPAFSKPVVERARVVARDTIAKVLNRPAGQSFDFVAEVARIVPARVILFITGLSEKYLTDLPHWSASVIAGLAGGANTADVLDETERTFKVMESVLREEVEQRRTHPQVDFLSTLLAAEFEGDRLSDDEVISTCIMTLLAGNDTTANTLGLSAVALAHNPDAWRYARQHPAQMPDFVMEMMRYVAMSTAQSRMVAQDFEWQGQQLRRGDLVYLVIAGANRDPKKFPDPERLDAERPQDGNLTFGPGLHMCIGHLVAKMQLEEFFTALFARFGGIEVLDSTLDWHTSLSFRGLRSLNARMIANS